MGFAGWQYHVHRGGIGVRPSFLNRMNHPVDADPVIEDAGAARSTSLPVPTGCHAKPIRGPKLPQRDPVLSGKLAVKLPDPWRNRTMSAFRDGPGIEVVRHDVADEAFGSVKEGAVGGTGTEARSWPEIGQVAILVP